jgi:hypothetical protein
MPHPSDLVWFAMCDQTSGILFLCVSGPGRFALYSSLRAARSSAMAALLHDLSRRWAMSLLVWILLGLLAGFKEAVLSTVMGRAWFWTSC